MNGEQTQTERLKEHLDRFAELNAHATFGLHNFGSEHPAHPAVKAYREIIASAEEGGRAIARELDGLA
jgi:hypothetical protein